MLAGTRHFVPFALTITFLILTLSTTPCTATLRRLLKKLTLSPRVTDLVTARPSRARALLTAWAISFRSSLWKINKRHFEPMARRPL